MSFFDQLIRFAESHNKIIKVIFDPERDREEQWYITCSDHSGTYFAYHFNLEKCSHKILEEIGIL